MSLVSTSIPNLINGVSQQPPALRMATQCTEMINCHPSVVEGLIKRPPTEYIDKLISGTVGDAHVHLYQRDSSEAFVVVIRQNSIKVFDLDGVEKTVLTPSGVPYLNTTTPRQDIKTMTVADYTFVLNTATTVTMSTSKTSKNTRKGIVFVKQGAYGAAYSVYVDGVLKATFTTSTTDVTQVATDYIAGQLATQLTTNLGAGWNVWRIGHVISIKKDDGTDFVLRTSDPLGGEALLSNTGRVQTLSQLPTTCWHSMKVNVAGDNNSKFDDYYVQFTANDSSFSEGYWSETVAPDVEYALVSANMPWTLVDNGDGTFTFDVAAWTQRTAGDTDSAPNPSFVGSKINDMAFFRDRLVLISGQNVVMSAAGDYFRFFPETVTDLLDDAPIDIAASHTKVALIRHGVPFNKQLLLFSDQTQFVLDADELLTPKTAAITTSTEFESSPMVKPVGAGQNVFFVTERGAYSGVREFFVDSDTDVNDAAEITAHIPQYVRSNIRSMEVSSAEDILALVSDDAAHDHKMFMYKYYWQGKEKLQSSWGRWEFNTNAKIRGYGFVNSTLYLIIEHASDGLFIEKVRLEAARNDDNQDHITHLDRRITDIDCTTITYSAGTNLTTWHLPYTIRDENMAVVIRGTGGANYGREITLTSATIGGTTITAQGDFSAASVWIGNKYLMYYKPTEPVVKESSGTGGQVAVQAGRMQVRNYLLSFDDTGYFNVRVTPKYRDSSEYPFTGRILGSGANILGAPPIERGVHRVPIIANSKEVEVEIESLSQLPVKLQSAEWEFFYTIRSARR